MQASWGNFAFPTNAAKVTNRTIAEMSPQGLPLRYITTYDVEAFLIGVSQTDLSQQEATLRVALSKPKQDFILKTDTGQISSSAIISKATMSGTRVRNIDFRDATDAEYVNRRTVTFSVDAIYLIANAANAVISWRQSIRIVGTGGPRRSWRFPVNAPSIRQQLTPFSLITATQSGEAVGHTRAPTPPFPIWPGYIVDESVDEGESSPENLGQSYINYPVTWSYRFERGDGPLIGSPGLPPGFM